MPRTSWFSPPSPMTSAAAVDRRSAAGDLPVARGGQKRRFSVFTPGGARGPASTPPHRGGFDPVRGRSGALSVRARQIACVAGRLFIDRRQEPHQWKAATRQGERAQGLERRAALGGAVGRVAGVGPGQPEGAGVKRQIGGRRGVTAIGGRRAWAVVGQVNPPPRRRARAGGSRAVPPWTVR